MTSVRQQMRERSTNQDSAADNEMTSRFSNDSEGSTMSQCEAAGNNVDQAADVIWRIIDRAIAVEARLRNLAEGALERLKLADNHIQSLEIERQAAEARIRKAEEELKQAELRIAVAEDQLAQSNLRAKTAETLATEVQTVLKRIECMEDAIRNHLHRQERESSDKFAIAA